MIFLKFTLDRKSFHNRLITDMKKILSKILLKLIKELEAIKWFMCLIKRYLVNLKWIKSRMKQNKYELQEIEIETLNRCNGICPFCPVNVNQPQRPYAKMSEDLFYKIISDLEKDKYSGKISLFSNNEPFLDDRIEDFIKYAKCHLPNAKHTLYTNGTLLTLDKFLNVIDYLDWICIDNYNDQKEVNDSLKDIYYYLEKHDDLKEKVDFSFRLQNEVLSSRGGQAPNKGKVKTIKEKCLLPYRMMIIRPTGEVSLCCNDALGKYTLGNLNNNSVSEVWNSDAYMQIRNHMMKKGRKGLNLCDACDTRTEPFDL